MPKIDMLFALIFVIKEHYTRFQKQTVFKTKINSELNKTAKSEKNCTFLRNKIANCKPTKEICYGPQKLH